MLDDNFFAVAAHDLATELGPLKGKLRGFAAKVIEDVMERCTGESYTYLCGVAEGLRSGDRRK